MAKLKAGVTGREGAGDSGEYGISWGFDEDAVAEDDDEEEEGMEGVDGEGMVSLSCQVLYFGVCGQVLRTCNTCAVGVAM